MFSTILDIINKIIPDEGEARSAAVKLEQEFTKRLSLKHELIRAEQMNGSGKWRVRLMYLCMTFVTMHFLMYDFYAWVVYYGVQLWGWDMIPLDEAPNNPEFWSFLKIGVGGYLSSRGIEKSVAWWRSK